MQIPKSTFCLYNKVKIVKEEISLSLPANEILSLCSDEAKKRFGEECKYEHLHTTYWNDGAYGLIETATDGSTLLFFDLKNQTLNETISIHSFMDGDFNSVIPLCKKLIEVGREFGVNESF